MIVEWFVSVATGFAQWVVGLWPELDIPTELSNFDDRFNEIAALGDGLGAFVDFPLVGAIAAIPATVWVAGLTIKGVRAALAHLPFFGGKG